MNFEPKTDSKHYSLTSDDPLIANFMLSVSTPHPDVPARVHVHSTTAQAVSGLGPRGSWNTSCRRIKTIAL